MDAIYGFTGPPDPALADRMAGALRHRGHRHAVDSVTDECTIGHVTDFDPHDRRRLGVGLDEREDLSVAVVGFLTAGQHGVPQPGDLLETYRRQGPSIFESLSGAFIVVLRDGDNLILARDGAGVRTAYFARCKKRFVFASEPKAILCASDFRRELRPAAVLQYLTFSFVPGSGTMLSNMHELLPGHFVTLNGAADPTPERYFHFEDPDNNGDRLRTQSNWVERFRTTHESAVARRLPHSEPVGVTLSGGLDSSIVTAEVARQHSDRVLSYAIHFGNGYPNELEFAKSVATRCETEHHEIEIRPVDFLPRLREAIWHLDEPIGDPVTMPNFEVSRRIAGDVCFVFNGEGGDPCFGGPKNIPMMLAHWYGGVPRRRHFREYAYLASYRRCFDDLEHLLTPEFLAEIDFERDLVGVLTPFFETESPSRFLDKLAAINIRLKGAHLILPKVERMTGATGLVPLSPLFDEELIRFSFTMPPQLRLAAGIEKVVLKEAYADALPEAVIHRPKSGMRVPVHYWFRKEMRRYAKRLLSRRSLKAEGIFRPQRVKQLLDYDIEEGPGRYGLRLWMLITFEIWRRITLDGESP